MKEVTRRIMSGLICVTMLVEASLMTSCNSASAEGSSESSTLVFEVADSTVDTGELSNTPETYVNPIAGTELAKYCTDNFVILDNSFGVANVYEIEVDIPLHLTREWNNEHVRMESNMSFMESQNWSYEYDLFWVQRWLCLCEPSYCRGLRQCDNRHSCPTSARRKRRHRQNTVPLPR